MTDDERQSTMDFIVAQQAQFSVDIELLKESQVKAEGRTARLERIARLMVKAGLRARKEWRESDKRWRDSDERWERRMEMLRESQAHTDKRLDALIDIVRQQRNGPAS